MKIRGMKKLGAVVLAVFVAGAIGVFAAETSEERFARLENEIALLKGEKSDLAVFEKEADKVHFGGYGEMHANFEDGGNDKFDIHRLVMYVGYDFADWIKLTSEVELEHAFVNDGDGELSIEQLYVDFLLADAFNVRVGRVLAPLGIINQHHEPVLFNGVERPNVEKNIIPSTWSLDGIGIFGFPTSWLSYEAYVVAGLDGSKFRAKDGVRKGRIKERGDLGELAVTGRLDFFPFVNCDLPADQDLRIGISGYYGGTDNKNEGGGNGVDNMFHMYSADFEYDVSRFQFRGVVAQGANTDADDLETAFGNSPGEEIFGWYLEGAVSVLPDSWKKGKLAEADVIPFVRYEKYDTQHEVPSNVIKSESNDRAEITVGVNVPLTSQLVLKTDYQMAENNAAGSDVKHKYNLGIGWVFQ